jgi:hypothetical protein
MGLSPFWRWFGTWNQVSIFSFLLRVINSVDKFSHVLRFTSCVFTYPANPTLFLQRTYDCILPQCTLQGICQCWPVLTSLARVFKPMFLGLATFTKIEKKIYLIFFSPQTSKSFDFGARLEFFDYQFLDLMGVIGSCQNKTCGF